MDFDRLIEMGLPSARGKRNLDVRMAYVRDLNAGDFELLLNPPKLGVETKPLVKLRNTHHMLARLLAEGRSEGDCSLMTGYSLSRVSILKNDPAFKDLMAYYATQTEARYLDVHERLASLGMATLDELQERLEAEPDSFKNRELLELAEFALDRSVTKEARVNTAALPPQVAITFVSPNGAAALPFGESHGIPSEASAPVGQESPVGRYGSQPSVSVEDISTNVLDLDYKDVP